MKAEHRKHLESNTLVESLGKLNQGLQQGLPRSVWLFLGAVAVVLLLFYTWRHFSERSQRANATLWAKWDLLDGTETIDAEAQELSKDEKFSLASNKEQFDLKRLEKFVKENAGTVQGRLARFQLARLFLFEGLRDLGHEQRRKQARERLTRAADAYAELIKEARDIPVLHQEAMLNCAKAHESLGETAEAAKFYKQLRDTYPKSDFGKLAEQQIQRLETDEAEIKRLASSLKEVPEAPFHP